MRAITLSLFCLGVLGGCVVGLHAFGSICLAQNYKCDWSVVGIGGNAMSSPSFQVHSTAGQTAAGLITGPSYWALIGFWQTEGQAGVREPAHGQSFGPLVTRLYTPQPNPARALTAVRYALAAETEVALTVHDLAGRTVRVLVSSPQKPGRYTVRWDGKDGRGRTLANGVYFCRFKAGDHREVKKLLLTR
jgi:hypothetical protein